MLLAAVPATGALVFVETTIHMQAAFGDEQLVARFDFTNTGSEPVRVNNVSASCGCTAPALKQKVYAPGESGHIDAVFTIGSRQGLQRLPISVNTDRGVHELIMQVEIPKAWELDPRLLYWRTDDGTTAKQATLRVYDPSIVGVHLPLTEGNWWSARLDPGAESGSWNIVVEPKADAPPAARDTLMLRLQRAGQPDHLASLYIRRQ
jgi:hypothetical protein